MNFTLFNKKFDTLQIYEIMSIKATICFKPQSFCPKIECQKGGNTAVHAHQPTSPTRLYFPLSFLRLFFFLFFFSPSLSFFASLLSLFLSLFSFVFSLSSSLNYSHFSRIFSIQSFLSLQSFLASFFSFFWPLFSLPSCITNSKPSPYPHFHISFPLLLLLSLSHHSHFSYFPCLPSNVQQPRQNEIILQRVVDGRDSGDGGIGRRRDEKYTRWWGE